jgi:hypothetical protein
MADSRSGAPVPAGPLPVKTGECPPVAELIDYARGHLGAEDRQRLDTHLRKGRCGYCSSWIERVQALAGSSPANPSSSTNPGGKWQRDAAFRDLQQRLQALEE